MLFRSARDIEKEHTQEPVQLPEAQDRMLFSTTQAFTRMPFRCASAQASELSCAGAMATPQELDNEAQQLETEAKNLEDEAIKLYHQQHGIPAQANIQRAETLRRNAGRKKDEAQALRSRLSGPPPAVVLSYNMLQSPLSLRPLSAGDLCSCCRHFSLMTMCSFAVT